LLRSGATLEIIGVEAVLGSLTRAVCRVGWLLPLCLLSVDHAGAHSRAGNTALGPHPRSINSPAPTNTVGTSTRLGFGLYDEGSPVPTDAEARLSFLCPSAASVRISIGQGVNPAPGSTYGVPLRQMSDGRSSRLGYNIYRDAERTQVWGSASSSALHVACTGGPQWVSIYGRAPAGQPVEAGHYSDSVLAAVLY
jgi:spore coat protein U-like protein